MRRDVGAVACKGVFLFKPPLPSVCSSWLSFVTVVPVLHSTILSLPCRHVLERPLGRIVDTSHVTKPSYSDSLFLMNEAGFIGRGTHGYCAQGIPQQVAITCQSLMPWIRRRTPTLSRVRSGGAPPNLAGQTGASSPSEMPDG